MGRFHVYYDKEVFSKISNSLEIDSINVKKEKLESLNTLQVMWLYAALAGDRISLSLFLSLSLSLLFLSSLSFSFSLCGWMLHHWNRLSVIIFMSIFIYISFSLLLCWMMMWNWNHIIRISSSQRSFQSHSLSLTLSETIMVRSYDEKRGVFSV